jgi:hypothetical protein
MEVESTHRKTKGSDSDAKEDGNCSNPQNGIPLPIVYWQKHSSLTEKAGKESDS